VGHNAQFALIGPQGIDVNLEHGSSLVHYVAGVTTRFVYKLMGQPELASVQDLRGRVVAVSRRGSMGYHGMRKVLELNQLRPDADVAFLYPGSDEAAFEAFLVGHADAVLASPPRDLVATRQGKKMLLDVEQLNIPFLGAGIIVRTDYAAANVDVVERFLKGYLQGIATWLTDPDTSVDVLAKYQQSDDRALLRAGYEAFRPTKSRDQLVPEEAVLATVQASEHPAARSANPREFYDNSYLERLKQSGFVDQLYAGR
jgi:ABC-type nitrate/sulfonate/bicarbonate transport system substrate-binding protein